MQILESSVLGLRTARLGFKSQRSDVRVTLFPMVHVGEPAFFGRVYHDALEHDVVLVEGVDSPIVRHICRSYRWIERSARVQLAIQPALVPMGGRDAKIVHADLAPDEFAAVWRKVPLWLRMAIYVVAPLIGLRRRWFATRESLSEGLSMDDQASQDELIDWSPEGAALDRAVLEARDERLLERLREQLSVHAQASHRVAVVYGAAHMRAVIRELTTRRNFQIEDTEWLTVFHR